MCGVRLLVGCKLEPVLRSPPLPPRPSIARRGSAKNRPLANPSLPSTHDRAHKMDVPMSCEWSGRLPACAVVADNLRTPPLLAEAPVKPQGRPPEPTAPNPPA